MFWRFHKAIFGERLDEAIQIVSLLGDSYQIVEGKKRDLPPPPPQGYESPGLALTTLQDAKDLPWMAIPGLFFDEEKYNIAYYMPRIGRDIPVLNRNGCFLPFGMLDMVPLEGKEFFVRPNSGMKEFPGQVINLDDPSAIRLMQKSYHVPSESLCWISEKKNLDPVEWRVWINQGKILTHTPYAWDSEPKWIEMPENVKKVAEDMANNEWQPDLSYVVDVGTNGQEAFVMELNATSTSGLYQAPLLPLLSGLKDTCEMEAKGLIYYEDTFSP